MENNKIWQDYFEQTKERPPRPLLVKAVEFVIQKGQALDLGSGAFNDVLYLLSQDFEHITAVDKEPVAQDIFDQLPKDKVDYSITPFTAFDFPTDTYALVNAQYSLPFISPEVFPTVFEKIKTSLKKGGIFTGQFFGIRDEWNNGKRNMSFYSAEETNVLLDGLEIIERTEEEKEGQTALGNPKHWHVFHIIARKN